MQAIDLQIISIDLLEQYKRFVPEEALSIAFNQLKDAPLSTTYTWLISLLQKKDQVRKRLQKCIGFWQNILFPQTGWVNSGIRICM
jgi:hypothetical protein